MAKKTYPAHEQMARFQDQTQLIGEFLEWLGNTKNLHICNLENSWSGHEFFPITGSTENLMAEFYGIDLKEVEKEKNDMLKDIKDMNKDG